MATTMGDFFTTRNTRQVDNSCSCPACTLLDCLQRPRFFAGQLISETDLNSQVDYMLAKQRLHNRYLHGVGTVCGLEVVCNNCDGYVTIMPGYAISPCGDDIIVCQQQAFDVLGAINACCNARKSKTNCDPYRPAADPGCAGLEQRWCITIKYLETPTQAVTPLRNPPAATCGCGCTKTNTNGNTKASACGCGTTTAVQNAVTKVQCEPTRVLESYQLGVISDPGTCDSPATLFGNTLFANLSSCISQVTNLMSQFSAASLGIISTAAASGLPTSQVSNASAYAACCQLRKSILALLNTSAGITDCANVAAFQAAVCPPPNAGQAGGSDPQYLQGIQDNILLSLQALFTVLRECICHNVLPPCPSDPTDDRLVLACVTVKDGKIIDICNLGCRQFAGGFPSFFYWLSAVPIVPLIKQLIDGLCCPVDSAPARIADGASVARPLHPLQQTLMEGNFALPKSLLQHFSDFAQKVTADSLASSVPAGQLNIATLIGMGSKDAVQALGMYNVSYEERTVNSRADIPLSLQSFIPFAKAGDHVVLFETNGSVVDAQSLPPTASSPGLADLRNQIETLRAEVATLKSNLTPPGNK